MRKELTQTFHLNLRMFEINLRVHKRLPLLSTNRLEIFFVTFLSKILQDLNIQISAKYFVFKTRTYKLA